MEVQALCAGCWRELALSQCPQARRHGTVTWHCPHCGLVIAILDRGMIRPYARARITTSGQNRSPAMAALEGLRAAAGRPAGRG